MIRAVKFVLVLALSSLSACVADDVRVERGCVTQCEVFHQQCQASAARLCNTCLNAIFDIGGDCASECSPDRCRPCSGGDTVCVQRPWRVRAENADPTVRQACDRARTRLDSCGERDAISGCERASRFERPEAAAVYQCVESLECGASREGCFAALSVGTLGDELQARGASCQWEARTPEQVQWLNRWEGWLRPSAASAMRECIALSDCSEAMDCVNAFMRDAL